MKLKTIITVLTLVLVLNTFSQKKNVNDELFAFALKKYENASRYQDVNTSISALNEMLSLKPEEKKYKENLLNLYYLDKSYNSLMILAKEMEAEGNTGNVVYGALAYLYKETNEPAKALKYYEKMNAEIEDANILFEMALIYFSLENYDKCSETLDKILGNTELAKLNVVVEDGKNGERVPLEAAVFNMAALMANAQGENTQSIEFFKDALQVYPEFKLAKRNLSALEIYIEK